jgi:carboxyl-terminal processing protease
MNGPRRSAPRPATVWLAVLAAFTAGLLAERSGWLPGSNRHEPPGLERTFTPFWEAWHLVEAHYVERDAVQPERMTQGSIEGLLNSLGDVGHTTYLTRDEVREMTDELAGQLEGIGAGMTVRDRRPTVMYTVPGSPARAAGLQPGDVLLQVNGKDVSTLPLERIVRLVRGPAGTTVRLRVLRPGESQPLDLELTRARVEVPSVTWRMLPGRPAAHVAVRAFGNHADEELKAALQKARAAGAKGLLLDLRGNPGGIRDQAVAVASEFLKDGVVFWEVDAQGKREALDVKPGGEATDLPLVGLIDQGSASSAEIVAGALQDHGRATLVGTRTFGTGTVLRPFQLSDGSAVLLAVAKWLTPKGREIWHHGIEPDVEVELPRGAEVLLPEVDTGLDAAALARSSDKQLLKALEVLQERLR